CFIHRRSCLSSIGRYVFRYTPVHSSGWDTLPAFTLAGDIARVSTRLASRRCFSGQAGISPADSHSRLSGIVHARETAQYSVVKERSTSRLPLRARLLG